MQGHKAVVFNLPGINVMLKKSPLVAFDDYKILLMLKHHSENRGLRHKGPDLVSYA